MEEEHGEMLACLDSLAESVEQLVDDIERAVDGVRLGGDLKMVRDDLRQTGQFLARLADRARDQHSRRRKKKVRRG